MKICLLCFVFPVRSETFVVRHVESLDADVIACRIDSELLKTTQVPIARTNSIGRPILLTETSLMGRCKQYFLRSAGKEGIKANQTGLKILEKILRKVNPSVVLIEFGHLAVAVAPVLRNLNLPFVVHFHGIDMSVVWKLKTYRRQVCALSESAAALIVVNDRLQGERIRSLGCTPDKIHCIPCGADVESFTVNQNIDQNPSRFICVGRHVPKKGPLLTLRAFKQVAEKEPTSELVMIGDGPLLKKCHHYVKKHRLSTKVRLTGAINHNQVVLEMKEANIFLQHSVTAKNGDEEGWPVSIAEGASCGMPVVSTLSGGIPENVVNGRTGFLVPENDVKSMADRMLQLVKDPSLRKAMGLAGRLNVENRGNIYTQSQKLRAVCHAAV